MRITAAKGEVLVVGEKLCEWRGRLDVFRQAVSSRRQR